MSGSIPKIDYVLLWIVILKLDQQVLSIMDNFIAPTCRGFLKILYQDNDILVIDKPNGLLSLSGKNPQNWDSVHHRLVSGQSGKTPAFKSAKLAHRLDFGTSGIMLVGLHDESTKRLNKQFQTRTIKKQYIAMLQGRVETEQGIISAPIAKDKLLFPRVKICQHSGKEAITKYNVLQRFESPARTLVKFTPITGRTHQLRIHSLFIQHPILGCDLYKSAQSEQMSTRLQLHASDLFFEQPMNHQFMTIHSEHSF
jgi:tRNA pseudouridine32 synthase/23S rRNA pseudouridine746 synthase